MDDKAYLFLSTSNCDDLLILRRLHLCGVPEPDIRSLIGTTPRSKVVLDFTVGGLSEL